MIVASLVVLEMNNQSQVNHYHLVGALHGDSTHATTYFLLQWYASFNFLSE